LHRSVGVSRVSIQPAAVAAESNPGARVTIIQDFTQTFRLMYSMNLQDSNDQIWVGEYDLSRHFTTRAVKQSDNSYRGEFRHDIRFGSSSGTTTKSVPATKQRITALQFTGGGPFSPEQLAKAFKAKAGQQYKPIKVRKGSDRLRSFLAKKGYLESRVRLDRQNTEQGLDLTVRIGLGPTVQMTFQGADLPGGEKKRVRALWSAGISDQQRPQTGKEAILGHLANKGFLRAEVDCQITEDNQSKAVRFDIKPGIKYHDVKIVVEGVEPYRARDILSLIGKGPLRQSVYRNPARAIEAITGFYRQRGYLAAKVAPPVHQLDAARQTGQIVIPVKEGPAYQVGEIQFTGNQALTASELQAGLPLEGGAVFEPGRLDPALAAVKLKYGKQGYREAHIEYAVARHDDRAAVDVSFTVVENRQTMAGSVKVEGNRHTSEKFALRQLRVSEGQVVNTQAVRESVKNLSQTGAYTSADIEVRPIIQEGGGENAVQVADLVVGVAEPKPFRLLYGGLYDTGNGPGFIADLQNHNTFGAGRVLGLRTRVDGQTDEFRLYLTQPTLRSRRISTTLGTYYTRETEDYQTTPTEKLGISIQQDLQLRSKLLLSYGYRYEKQRGFIPDPAAPVIPESIVTVSPVTLTLTREARDNYLDATRGSFMSHGIELAPKVLGSDYPYLRYYLQYFKYFPLTKPRSVPFGEKPLRSRLVFATGSRVGLQKGFNSTGAVLTDRFYAGGGTTIRGFHQDELGPRLANGQPAGGNAVLVLNEEIRYPLFRVFDAVTFVDIGNVFPRVSDFRIKDLRSAGGFGLRIRNPFVVLRFDYGFKFGRRPGESIGAFFFSIGQAF
jgi:outer membrane protein assembly complex protein YaeT